MQLLRVRKKDSVLHIPMREITRVEVLGNGSATITTRCDGPVTVKDAAPVIAALEAEGTVAGPQSVFEAIFGK